MPNTVEDDSGANINSVTINNGDTNPDLSNPQQSHQDLVIGSFGQATKQLVKFAGPVMLAQCIFTAANYSYTLIFSNMSADALAASGIISTTQNIIVVPTSLSLYGASNYISSVLPKGELRKVASTWHYIIATAAGYTLILSPAFIFGVEPILGLMNIPAHPLMITQKYFQMYPVSYLPSMLLTCNYQVLMGNRLTIPILVSSSMQNAAAVLLSFGFALGKFGLPNLDVQGFSVAQGTTTLLAFIGSLLYLKMGPGKEYHLFRLQTGDAKEIISALLRKGVAFGAITLMEFMAIWASMMMSSALGQKQLSAAQIVQQYMNFLTIPCSGLSRATTILISQLLSQGNQQGIRQVTVSALALSQILPAVSYLLFVFLGRQLSEVFLTDENPSDIEAILGYAKPLLLIAGAGAFFDGIRQINMSVLMGLDFNLEPAIINVLSVSLLGVGLSYILAFQTGLGLDGVYLGRMLGLLLAAGATGIRVYQHLRSSSVQVQPAEEVVELEEVLEVEEVVEPAQPEVGWGSKLKNCRLFNFFGSGTNEEKRGLIDNPQKKRSCCTIL